MIQKEYNYIEGSAAKQINYDVYEENRVLKAKKQYKNSRKVKFRLIISLLAVFMAGLLVMYRFALVTQISYNINKSEQEYNQLRNANSLIKMQVEKETNLASVKEAAENKLGMQKPDKSQIVYINVPRSDYTVKMDASKEEEKVKGSIFTVLLKKITGLVDLIG